MILLGGAADGRRVAGGAAIRAVGLTKDYGKGHGLFDLDLEVRRGEVFGFLGPNGAGKSTTMRLLLDLIRPTSGTATLLGLDAHTASLEIATVSSSERARLHPCTTAAVADDGAHDAGDGPR